MILIVYNLTATPLSYLGGLVTVPASGSTTVSNDYVYDLSVDAQFRNDVGIITVDVGDSVNRYGSTDAIKYIDSLNGVRGLTSTKIVTGVITHQALDVNVTSGTSTGAVDNSTFTYSDSVQQTLGGVYNDIGAAVISGRAAAARITQQRALHVNLRDNSGNELGVVANPITVTDILQGTTGTNGAITVGTSAVSISVSGTPLSGRKSVAIYNNSAVVMYWGYSNAVTTSNGFPLFPGRFYEWGANSTVTLFIIAGTAGNNARVVESP